jgi:hypothetical protein
MSLKGAVLEAEVVVLGFNLIIVIFRRMRGGRDNETATEG